jgi:hypothetical protein
MTELRCLTIREPWAWCTERLWVDPEAKGVENRSRSTRYRGLVGLQAGLTLDREALDDPLVLATIGRWNDPDQPGEYPWSAAEGHVTAVAELYDVCGYGPKEPKLTCPCGDPWAWRGRYHWCWRNVRPLRRPVPARGTIAPPLWTPEPELAERILAGLA